MNTEYATKNETVTGMSDDEFYGREEALNVDLDACHRAAVREARRAYDHVVMTHAETGKLMLRRAAYRLALALGNQSRAEDYLYQQPLAFLGNVVSADERADRAELDRAAARQHPHPALLEALEKVEAQLHQSRISQSSRQHPFSLP